MSESGASFGGKFQGPGGTPGGLGEAFAGLAMLAVGIYLVFDHVTVRTSFWRFFGSSASTRFTSGMNPMSSIRSASSSTKISMREKSTLPWP